MAASIRAAVGRDAPIPPDPAAVRTPAGGYGIRPYSQRQVPRPTGKRHSHVITNLCRGRCSHRPGNPAAARTPAGGINPAPTNKFYVSYKWEGRGRPGGRRAGCPIPPDPAAARTSAGGYGIPPYSQRKMPRSTGKRHSHVITNLCRGRCSHRPGNPAAARTPAGGINPAPTNNFFVLGQPEWPILSGRP